MNLARQLARRRGCGLSSLVRALLREEAHRVGLIAGPSTQRETTMIGLSTDETARESRLRRRAAQQGLALRKSRARQSSLDNHGGWMIVDPGLNAVVAGQRYDWSLDDVENYLREGFAPPAESR